ncbi:hypothetical protein DHEL01_v203504 [Diaporthe helianthi]|uniref:RING-type domain-containing protein n=1 Tax=Diaporthe helianthi TaxID=158607 RepID=A0A2P5I6J9_DIAHE|nr:hypothetical protein DHEL01_v203504 [Diaporthe helianthi]
MLSVQRPEAPPVAAMQDQDDGDQGFSLLVDDETKSQCRISVNSTLPDIDPEYLTRVCTEAQWDPNRVIDRIFDQMENGNPYPRVPKPNLLKRKRDDEEQPSGLENAAAKFDNEERRRQWKANSYKRTCDMIMQQSFPECYAEDLRRTFTENGNCLYPAFLQVAATVASSNDRPPYRKKSRVTQISGRYDLDSLADRIRTCSDQGEREALEEFMALRELQAKQHAESQAEREREVAENTNLQIAMLEGNVADCGCCFVEYALNRMVHCDGETLHWFCRDCARMMAETQIGLSKYRLDCMSTDGCAGSFAMDQKEIFLNKHSMTALDRIEQEAVLREAGIENLETCPQCPFAAEYPPIEVDKEFRCLNPDCAITSCRSCRKETHVPKTCAEAALDNGHSARHEIEEAMSAALIRTCNKCSAPFIKENGCNKMTCTKCRNIQCYVCSKSCDYSHFNDASRGGKTGNCPLFDDGHGVEKRHRDEVRAAEEQARKKALELHPEVRADLLEFQLSDKVKKDEEQKALLQNNPQGHYHRHGRLARIWHHHRERHAIVPLEEAIRNPPLPAEGVAPAAAPIPVHLPQPRPYEWHFPQPINIGDHPQMLGDFLAGIDEIRPLPHRQLPPRPGGNRENRENREHRPPPHPMIRRSRAPRAPEEVVAPVPAMQNAVRPNAQPPAQAPRPQAQAYVNPRAVFGQLPVAEFQPGPGHWEMMRNFDPEMGGVGRLVDNYRQGEHPEASPVGNGQIGDANQIDYNRLWGRPQAEEPAMNNDAREGWHAVLDLRDLTGLNPEAIPFFPDPAPGPFPADERGMGPLGLNDLGPSPFVGQPPLGSLDDLFWM